MNALDKKSQRADATTRDPRWAAVVARDQAAEGAFWYAVTTTGVYCRPTCAARPARPENVQFYSSRAQAEAAGFRACKRCKPDQAAAAENHALRVTEACRLIEESEQSPSLDTLAAHARMSPFHFHRVFKSVTGVTPKQYAIAHRGKRMRSELARGTTVTDAIYASGYNSNARYYEKSNDVLGMTASAYRAGGANSRIRFAVGQCSLGSILVARSDQGICAILLGDDPDALARDLQDRFANAELIGGDVDFERLVAVVVGFIEAPGIGLDLPLDVRGTAFQQRVWQALREIPPGSTASYSDVARRIGAPKSMRAVAAACAANSLAVAIPCHRVIKRDGALSGYRWGVERKRALLSREAQG
jgi:AraC family transcriptional regulator, regulatory protein of adaptative response / methylated-DNA-[protein]-cysteine methyltransferase